jgi:hypothetical protein
MEEAMHKTVLTGAMALAVFGAGTLIAGSAAAAPQGLRPAIESLNPLDTVASCWRNGHYVRHCGHAPREQSTRDQAPQEFGSAERKVRADAPVPHRYFSRW